MVSICLLLLIIFGAGSIHSFYQNSSNFVKSFFDRSFDYQRFSEMQAENQRLLFEIEKLSEESPINRDLESRRALVYSRYPFSGSDRIIINAGREEGVSENMPVLHNGFLFGKILDVSNHQSEVQTIFDSEWTSSVGVGDYSDKAVLEGGGSPSVDLIPRDSSVLAGDDVFNLSPDYPIYQPLGSISMLESKTGEIWKTGQLDVPYIADEIKEVEVLIDFP